VVSVVSYLCNHSARRVGAVAWVKINAKKVR
jgi:hypothetical protein